MFKVKVKQFDKSVVLDELGIIETKEYKYVLMDDPSFFENGKINIIFSSEEDLNEIKKIIKYIILGVDYYINIENSNGIKNVNVRNIDYFEALDNDVFAIYGKDKYYVLEKLYVLEEKLIDKDFIRVSKSFLVNITKIIYIRPLFNYKLELIMNNGDKIDVNRTYMKVFKERMKLR